MTSEDHKEILAAAKKMLSEMLQRSAEHGIKLDGADVIEQAVIFCLTSGLCRADMVEVLKEEGIPTKPVEDYIDGFWKRIGPDREGMLETTRSKGYLEMKRIPYLDLAADPDAYAVGFYLGFTTTSRMHPDDVASEMPGHLVSTFKNRIRAVFGPDPKTLS